MSDIPQARRIIEAVVDHLKKVNDPRAFQSRASLRRALRLMTRQSPAMPRSKSTSRPMTWRLAEKIRRYKRAHPDVAHSAVGALFGTNGGRVSEALHGKWPRP